MSKLLIQHGEWVVVCDGAKALVLENAGDAKFPNLKTIKVFEQKDLATHDLGTGPPGRAGLSRATGPASRWRHRRRQDEVNHPGRVAARARHDPSGLFARAARRGARRGGQGPRQAADPRDREAPDRRLRPLRSAIKASPPQWRCYVRRESGA